jgi:DNA-binding LytR/AlgR family response regulator
MSGRPVSAVIADDEPLLAAMLERMLRAAWPQLAIARVVHDGRAALQAIDDLHPDIAFLDIRMPALSGLEVAAQLARGQGPLPALVFVTAYDQYAVDAFEAAAVDYLLKPVGEERLARCVARLQARVAGDAQGGTGAAGGAASAGGEPDLPSLLARLQQRLDAAAAVPGRLRFLRASLGDVTRQIPVDEVLYFEARDKYVAVVTRDASALVRLSLSELLDGLDPEQFTQIHRSTVVRLDAIDTIRRDLTGRSWVHLREKIAGREVRLAVSRQFAARFRGM